jgi:predicted PhzF superfamily epimerase YddE/YHI9
MSSIKVDVFRVFVDENGKYGNPVGIVVDEVGKIGDAKRLQITQQTGFSECVFVENMKRGQVRIYNPQQEVDFAGHAVVGVARFLMKALNLENVDVSCKKGKVAALEKENMTWIETDLKDLPPWNFRKLESARAVEEFNETEAMQLEHTMIWAWMDKHEKRVRARTFAPDWGIPEDEANGSGSMLLAAKLHRELKVKHGKGSIIFAEQMENEQIRLGGKVQVDENIIL